MTDTFGAAAARLCSAAALLLGWRPAEFWNSTPAELELVVSSTLSDCAAPDASIIEELRRRFPDELRHDQG